MRWGWWWDKHACRLGNAIESEDIMYFADYLTSKFLHYQLGVEVQEGEKPTGMAQWPGKLANLQSHKYPFHRYTMCWPPDEVLLAHVKCCTYFNRALLAPIRLCGESWITFRGAMGRGGSCGKFLSWTPFPRPQKCIIASSQSELIDVIVRGTSW